MSWKYVQYEDGKYRTVENGGGGGDVTSVNGQTGDVVLDADDVGALPDSTAIPSALSELSDDSTHRVVTDAEKSTWNGKSDFSGSYNDLTDKPTIPAAQVNSDWNAVSGVAQILNKPTIPVVTGKADKVTGATNGNLAGLDGNGNLTDSGIDGDMTTASVTGNPLSFTTDSEQAARSCVITLEPIQAGSGDPSPSNVRDIGGYKKVELAVPRKNLIPITLQSLKTINTHGTWNNNVYDSGYGITFTINTDDNGFVNEIVYSGTATTGFDFYVASGLSFAAGNYYLNGGGNGGGPSATGTWRLVWNRGSSTTQSYDLTTDNLATLDSDINDSYLNIHFFYGAVATNVVAKPMIRLASIEDGTYEPYNPITDIALNLPKTVYGCTLDVESGVLTVTRNRIDLGDLTWNYGSGSQVFNVSIPDKKDGDAHFVCEIYKDGGTAGYAVGNKEIAWNNGVNYRKFAFVKDTDYSTKETFTTAVTGKYLVYDLAEPYTIQLTPAQVRLLQGSNVVTSNGTSIALTYRNGEVASLADVSSVAESVNALGEQSKTKIIASAVGDGIKTYKNLLDELYPYYLKLSTDERVRSYIEDANGYVFVSHSCLDSAGRYTYISGGSGSLELRVFLVRDNNSMANRYTIETSGNSITNLSSSKPSNTFYLKVK